jgi:TP901 family phage tail tape measure protein
MVTVVRAEAVLTAQNKLRPGLAAAAAELGRFRAMQAKATTAFTSTAARAMASASQRTSAAMAAAQGRLLAAGRSQLVTLGGPAALGASYKQYADMDRGITRIGLTANASAEELAGVRKEIEGIAFETAQSSAKVTGGLNVLVSQGRSLKEGLQFLPSVARTAAATGSEVADIAKSADAVATNFKIAGGEMQKAFDIMSESGKAGQFELPDMAQYIPALAPAAAAVGFTGTKGLTELLSILQIMRKGSGSSSDAYVSLNNILMKMDSDETRKNFKKFGIDSSAALAKTRKEGGNVVETFENLIKIATKGDDAKIGEIVKDAEFKRGVLALRAYAGEWQKMAKTVGQTANGSVGRDLERVTADARAQIDRMMSAIENRAVELGSVLAKYVVLPLDKSLRDIQGGKNETVNRVNGWASNYVNDIIAKSELDGGTVHDYDPASRKKINARKEYLTPQKIEDARSRIRSEITDLEAKRKRLADDTASGNEILPAHLSEANSSRASGDISAVEGQITALRDRLRDIESLVSTIGSLNQSLAEVQGARDKALSPRMSLSNVSTDVESLAEAGRNAGRQFTEALTAELARATSDIAPQIARLKSMMSFTSSPSINPRVNGSVSGLPTGYQGAE